MPELLPHYDRVCALVGQDEGAHRMLSHYRPAAALHGCSVAVWRGEGGPALVRNYDYHLDKITARIELTHWDGMRVLAMSQRPWGGCLDGVNAKGLAAAMTLGGGVMQSRGFAVILMLRYVLETCSRVEEATRALCRIPIVQAQNVVLLDATGRSRHSS